MLRLTVSSLLLGVCYSLYPYLFKNAGIRIFFQDSLDKAAYENYNFQFLQQSRRFHTQSCQLAGQKLVATCGA